MTDKILNSEIAEGAEHWHMVRHGTSSPELKEATRNAAKAEKKVARTAAEAASEEQDRLVKDELDRVYGASHAAEILASRFKVTGRAVPETFKIPAKTSDFVNITKRDFEELQRRVAADDLALKTRGGA